MAESCFRVDASINPCSTNLKTNFVLEQDGIIFNREDIKTLTRDANNPNIVTDLVLKTNTLGYVIRFKELKPLNELSQTTEEKPFGKTYKVEGEFVIYGHTAEAAEAKRKLDNSRVCLLMRQSAQAGTSSYRVLYGLESGLKPAAGEGFNKEKGGYVFKFMEESLTYPDQFLWKATEATTAAVEAALLVAGV